MRSTYGIHWQKPTTMVIAWVLGAALALGHHFFYRSLRNKPIPDGYLVERFGLRLSEQQINIAVGSTFAFLVKALVGVAVSTGFGQIVWMAAKMPASTKVKTVDDLFSPLADILALFNAKLWAKFPGVMLVAAVSWLLPFASVVTPATLSVQFAAVSNSSFTRIPRIDFTSLNFADLDMGIDVYAYSGPALSVQRLVGAAAAHGDILPVPAPAPNSSWTLDFRGPALECGPVDEALNHKITENVLDALLHNGCEAYYGYISWIPGHNSNGSLPFSSEEKNGISAWALQAITLSLTDPLSVPTVFIATFPGINSGYTQGLLQSPCQNAHSAVVDSKILKCTLYNASYSTDFAYRSGVQDISVSISGGNNEFRFLDSVQGEYPLLVSDLHGYPIEPHMYNISIVETFAWQAVLDAFERLIMGTITTQVTSFSSDNAGIALGAIEQYPSTAILSTVLGANDELAFLGNPTNWRLQDLQNGSDKTDWNGLSVIDETQATISLAETLEQLFHNITVSLMSSELLQPNYSSPYAPPNTTVTFTYYHNIYIYSASILWAAYGLALFFSILCVAYGSFAIVHNKASYSSKFSTILRTTRDAKLTIAFEEADTRGEDPLPKRIGEARITFDQSEYRPEPEEAMSLRTTSVSAKTGSSHQTSEEHISLPMLDLHHSDSQSSEGLGVHF